MRLAIVASVILGLGVIGGGVSAALPLICRRKGHRLARSAVLARSKRQQLV
jgi:hypothetical protein